MIKTKLHKQVQVVVAVLSLCAAPIVKATVLYDESVSGDSTGGQLFTLTNGSNVFSGAQAWTDAVDGFRFVVAAGTQATIKMNYSYSNLPVGEAMAMEWDLNQLPAGTGSCTANDFGYNCAGGGFGSTYVTLFTANSEPGFGLPAYSLGPDLSTVVLGPGIYAFNDNYKFSTSQAAQSAVLNYSIDVEQTVVPLPSSMWLFGSGLFGLLRAARRHV